MDKEKEVRWRCLTCGTPGYTDPAPEKCPKCGNTRIWNLAKILADKAKRGGS